jgi:Uma2 family endonuclease
MALPVTKTEWTVDQFLAWEHDQAERHEFVGGEIFAMTGARDGHNTIAGNLFATLRSHLRGNSCRAYIADMKLHVTRESAVFYPDVMVTCDSRDLGPQGDLEKQQPKLIVEVLSESTAAYDRGEKFRAYRSIEALEEYVLIDQDKPYAEVFRKDGSGHWVLYPTEAGEVLRLESVGLTLSLAEVYEDVTFGDR